MKIAVFFEKDRLRAFNDKDVEILVFQIRDNQVTGVESCKPNSEHGEYRMQILKNNGVSGVYLLEIDDEWRRNLQENNISVTTGKMLAGDKLFNSLYFSNLKSGS